MPGVPSGRGCEACRKQKKKCDQAVPSCSRCTRLRLVCVGAGLQRYKFVEQQQPTHASTNGIQMAIRQKRSPTPAIPESIYKMPSNASTLLVKSFVTAVCPATDLRFNLAWSYGGYLTDVPSRLGINDALDAAAEALVESHSNYCSGQGRTIDALEKYTIAIRKLRLCLDDPQKAKTSETLCAVQLLLLCQTFLGNLEGNWTGHVEGMAQVLKVRGSCDPKNVFEARMLASMRGSLIFEGMLNSKVKLSAKDWQRIADNPLDRGTIESKLMHSLCMVPYLIQNRGRSKKPPDYDETAIVKHIEEGYQILMTVLKELKQHVDKIAQKPFSNKIDQTDAYHLRTYALTLTIAIILNCVLSGLNAEDTQLLLESEGFARDTLVIAEHAKHHRPLGANYAPMCLSFAWIATTDEALKLIIEDMIEEYQQHPSWGSMAKYTISNLGWTSRRLRLMNPPLSSESLYWR